MTYSHRNGEMEPPEIMGYYWFVGKINGSKPHARDGRHYEMMLLLPYQIAVGGKLFFREDITDAQWWGPVTPPWESEK
jgi:hypothetical protein